MYQHQPTKEHSDDNNPYQPPRVVEASTYPSAPPNTKTLIDEHALRHEEFTRSAVALLVLDEEDPSIITQALHNTIDLCSAAAEAQLDLVLSLIHSPSTPETDSLLAGYLAELTPGPYADLLISSLSENARVSGEVKQTLSATLQNWTQAHGDNQTYAKDISRLTSLLAPKSFLAKCADIFKRFFNS